ncbi:hypothetical protein DFH07DRAFT_790740 [Mycena maculata]|uniref:Uncharacterized protein n=1 Tax=Mycena maculata TaxID=230809 RepID=A0AAD7KBZ6_9AGAR|nr:hypothetical protein DFH07DRAFT_790740 [Mycena maculata]
MAERRAAAKTKKRQWDPPSKAERALVEGGATGGPAARHEPAVILRTVAAQERPNVVTCSPSPAAPAAETDGASGDEAPDEEYRPGGERLEFEWGTTKSERNRKASSRKASATYYVRHGPEIREKQRIRMAEKRVAAKEKKRQWDPPNKAERALIQGGAAADHTARPEPDIVLRTAAARRRPQANVVPHSPSPAAASDTDGASGDETPDEEYRPGGERSTKKSERNRKASSRKASVTYYARHGPEIREKQRIRMAEKRALIKARRRRWDPPKKTKPAVPEDDAPRSDMADSYRASPPDSDEPWEFEEEDLDGVALAPLSAADWA